MAAQRAGLDVLMNSHKRPGQLGGGADRCCFDHTNDLSECDLSDILSSIIQHKQPLDSHISLPAGISPGLTRLYVLNFLIKLVLPCLWQSYQSLCLQILSINLCDLRIKCCTLHPIKCHMVSTRTSLSCMFIMLASIFLNILLIQNLISLVYILLPDFKY